MEKNLKKCYQYLDLPFSATLEEVESRKKALIKILNSKAMEKKISCEKEIALVERSANAICENLKNNSTPIFHRFESSTESIFGLIIVLMFVLFACFFSFYTFL